LLPQAGFHCGVGVLRSANVYPRTFTHANCIRAYYKSVVSLILLYVSVLATCQFLAAASRSSRRAGPRHAAAGR